ncbi:MAG: hypothetical protein IAI48_05320 [Candidatus Eremiobacteraeota bacterium]|nr:hypothetical protein [Candidatus Eremiobacteraeota bacterium]
MGRIPRTLAVVAALVLVTPRIGIAASHARGTQPVVFAAPAGDRPAGPPTVSDADGSVLPSGRLLRPAGTSVVTGSDALGFALTPDGRYAIVSNGDDRASTLAVVDTATMTVTARYANAAETFYAGVVALPDPVDAARTLVLASGGASNAVYVFDLSESGELSADAHHVIPIANGFPATIVSSGDGRRAFVVDTVGDDVAQIDLATRKLAGIPAAVGFFPYGAALTPLGLLVANEGLTAYGTLATPAAAPPFEAVAPDLARASSLSLLPLESDATIGERAVATPIALDRTPDGVRAIGGAHPAAIVSLKTRPYAFVALANVDRVATIALAPGPLDGPSWVPRAVGGTELRLYDRGPYGTQPTALALSADEKRLYVALSGIDAVAVLDTTDPLHPHRVGLISTGWYPTALAVSADERYLFVTNARGDAQAGATLERIDLRSTDLRKTTPAALAALRTIRQPNVPNPIVPQRFSSRGSTVVKHVVLIVADGDTPDEPNLHALALRYGLATNVYADATAPDVGHQYLAAGIASDYTEKTALVRRGRRALPGANQDPEDYPRAGYIWNSLAVRGRTYRDYGDLVHLSGYDAGLTPDAGLGGTYSLNVPALAALLGHVDLAYPGWNPHVTDSTRADEFVRDFDALVKLDNVPALTEIWLPSGTPADGDRALGTIVAYLTHVPQWKKMAIVIVPADAQPGEGSDAARTYALVVSPYAKRRFVGTHHLSTVSVLKTEEELLGLPALSLGDELATDMSDFFTPVADRTPFDRVDAP